MDDLPVWLLSYPATCMHSARALGFFGSILLKILLTLADFLQIAYTSFKMTTNK